VDRAVVVRLLELLGTAMEGARAGADPRTRLELALVKAARPEVDASTPALLARIERLERERAAPAPPVAAEVSEAPSAGVPETAAAATDIAYESAAVTEVAPEIESVAEIEPVAKMASESVAEMASELVPVVDVVPEPAPAPEPAPEAVTATDLESLCALWPAVVDVVRAGNALIGALMADTRPVAVAGEDLTVAFASSAAFLKKKAEHPDNRAIVTDALRQVTGGRWRLSYELLEVDADPSPEQGAPTEEEWVRRFMEEFDAEELLNESTPAAAAAGGAAGDEDEDEQVSVNSEPKEA
jgi:DNA polymerase-3 subunit gamma/tau